MSPATINVSVQEVPHHWRLGASIVAHNLSLTRQLRLGLPQSVVLIPVQSVLKAIDRRVVQQI